MFLTILVDLRCSIFNNLTIYWFERLLIVTDTNLQVNWLKNRYMGGKLHQTYLMVTDLENSVQFYRDILGIDIDKIGESQAKFDTGESTLVLERDFEESSLKEFGLEPPGDERGEGVIVVIEVDDVETIYDRAKNAGVDI